jgi:ubiquitin C-terminal hydrolase
MSLAVGLRFQGSTNASHVPGTAILPGKFLVGPDCFQIFADSACFQIASQKRKQGYIAPKAFVQKLRRENEMFRGYMHQDAHEFLNFTLNEVADNLVAEIKDRNKGGGKGESSSEAEANSAKPKSFVHDIFEGALTNETKCLECESITIRVSMLPSTHPVLRAASV